jgi:FkbM family methyltransferase
MIVKILRRLTNFLDVLGKIGIKKYCMLKRDGVHYSRYQIFNRKWITDLDICNVLDIGANVGEFTLIFHHLFDDPIIHSFEPLPSCKAKLDSIVSNRPNITFHSHALGARESTEVLHVSSHAPSSSILNMGERHKIDYPHSADSSDVGIQCKSLDSVLGEVTFEGNLLIKIDVQGFEKEVIQGGHKVFSAAKIVVLEMSIQELYDGEAGFDELYSILKSLGFTYHGSLKQSVSKNDESFLQCDGVFINHKLSKL